jgi:hypothetical protein
MAEKGMIGLNWEELGRIGKDWEEFKRGEVNRPQKFYRLDDNSDLFC